MIHVLCLNPAVDKIYRIAGFAAGEDYPGQTPETYGGGKGVNVARVLSQLGVPVHLYAFLGETGGETIKREMETRCACTFLTVPGACRTTVNIIDTVSARETVITEKGPIIRETDHAALLSALARGVAWGDTVCCSGSIIAGAPNDFYAQVSCLCAEKGAHCVLDCNAQTLPASLAGAQYLLGKPNERELCALLGEERTQEPQRLVRLARRLTDAPYASLLVSMGAAGGVYVTESGAWFAQVPTVAVRSTVGSGDACFAGALSALCAGETPQDVLAQAMACGAVNAALGGNGSVERQAVAALKKKIRVIRIEAE